MKHPLGAVTSIDDLAPYMGTDMKFYGVWCEYLEIQVFTILHQDHSLIAIRRESEPDVAHFDAIDWSLQGFYGGKHGVIFQNFWYAVAYLNKLKMERHARS